MTTDLVQLGDDLLRTYSPYDGEGLRNHCLRIAAFARLAGTRLDTAIDPDVTHLLSMTHDLGLVSEQDVGVNYLQRSWALFEREMTDRGRTDLLTQDHRLCITHNHRLSPIPNASPTVEAFRRAVWIEHSLGTKRFGLPRSAVRAIFRQYPRDNFTSVMMDFWRRVLLHEPKSVVNGIFL